jgi:ribosomal subunit interface protein
MKLNISGHETTLTPEVKKYAEKKINKLCKKYKQIIDADIVIEENHNKTEKTAAKARAVIKIAGKDITATSEARTVFAAIDELERKLTSQLAKEKAKHNPSDSRIAKSKEYIRNLFIRESKDEESN